MDNTCVRFTELATNAKFDDNHILITNENIGYVHTISFYYCLILITAYSKRRLVETQAPELTLMVLLLMTIRKRYAPCL